MGVPGVQLLMYCMYQPVFALFRVLPEKRKDIFTTEPMAEGNSPVSLTT